MLDTVTLPSIINNQIPTEITIHHLVRQMLPLEADSQGHMFKQVPKTTRQQLSSRNIHVNVHTAYESPSFTPPHWFACSVKSIV